MFISLIIKYLIVAAVELHLENNEKFVDIEIVIMLFQRFFSKCFQVKFLSDKLDRKVT